MQRLFLFVFIWQIALVSCSPSAVMPTTPKLPTATSQPQAFELRGAMFEPPRLLADFEIASTTGQSFSLDDFEGKWTLLYFGYRTCPDFCPMTFSDLRKVYNDLGEPADVMSIIFITVDPERDSLEALSSYVTGFHSDFIGLRAEGEALQQLMNQFGAVAQRQQMGDSALSYLIDHTASIFLIGADGRLWGQYLYGTDSRDIFLDMQAILGQSD